MDLHFSYCSHYSPNICACILLKTSVQQIWAKSTMEGVRSAITSRKVISSSMKFEFQRSNLKIDESEVVQEFELTLSRPMGIHIEGGCF